MHETSKRVAFLLPSLGGGGAEKVVVNLVNELCENENLVIDLVLGDATGKYVELVNGKVQIVNLESPRMIKTIFKIVRYLKNNKPDVLISGLDYVNVIALIAKKLAGVNTKILITEHNTLSQTLDSRKSVKTSILINLMRRLYSKADQIIAVSKGVAADLCNVLGVKDKLVKVIYNPVINDHIIQQSYEEIDHKWVNDSKQPVILGIGRLTLQKDFEMLIKAFSILKSKVPAKLIILGEGELRNDLEAQIKSLGLSESIDLYGFHNNPYAFIRQTELFVLSSRWEGLPTVLIEALACDATVVSTDCKSGPREILAGGKYGKLVDVGDFEGLAVAMEESLSKEKQNSKEEIKSWLHQFRAEEVTLEYKKLIQSLL